MADGSDEEPRVPPKLVLVHGSVPEPAPLLTADEVLLERVRAAQDRSAAERHRQAAARDLARASAYLQVAHRDELTGAMQRWPGLVDLSKAVNLAHLRNRPLVVAFVDVDGLKQVNDTSGHAAGDHLLRALGTSLRQSLRAGDVVLRYGGDEFVCALPDAELPDAELRLLDVGRGLRTLQPSGCISVGLVQLAEDESAESVVRRADQAMYQARSLRRTAATPVDL